MNTDLTFGEPFDLPGESLPFNFFPAAFGILADQPGIANRIVLQLPDAEAGPRVGASYHVIAAETLKDPAALQSYFKERGSDGASAHLRSILGPVTTLNETTPNEPIALRFDPVTLDPKPKVKQVGVIIDIGIAYWNAAFQGAKGPRFKAMSYLDFDAFQRGKPALELLPFAQIEQHCLMAAALDGQDRIVAQLAAQFPDSYFADPGGAVAGTLWHGTAMADLMAGLPFDAPDSTALMGIELPMQILRDSDGDNLAAVLGLLVEAAVAMTASQFAKLPLVIALPWGFTAGPQDATHPAIAALDRMLAKHPDRQIKLLVSMGNQMQDRACAHLSPSELGEQENAVTWRIPPDDFSANTVECLVAATGQNVTQQVRVTPPIGQSAVILMKEAQGVLILQGAAIVGALLRYLDTGYGPRLRLVLAPTAWQAGVSRPCPAGDWALSFHQRDDVRIWILRDDRDPVFDKAQPHRASELYDPAYRTHDSHGAYLQTDDPACAVVRAGTASLLATGKVAVAVAATETLGNGTPQTAWYSGTRTSRLDAEEAVLVDAGRHNAGVLAAANGSGQMMRVSGTSAAVALAARNALGLPARAL